nr:nucleolar snRNP protein [Cryptomonas sp.]
MDTRILKKIEINNQVINNFRNKTEKISNKLCDKTLDASVHETLKKKRKYLYRPFVRSFSGHVDGVLCIKRHSKHPSLFFSGGSDGQVKFWIVSKKKCIHSIQAHESFIRDLAVDFSGLTLLSCSDDFSLKLWHISEIQVKPKACFENNSIFNSISTHPSSHFFATGGKEILLWDLNKFEPIQKLVWGLTSVSRIQFNPIEHNIISSCGSDRSILFCDLRIHKPIEKVLLDMRSNDISWSFFNPWEFTVANEDSNLYSFDLRNLKEVSKIYRGHVMPVLSIDQDPTSQLFASGSCDNTIRLYKNNVQVSNEIFFTQRMRRILDLSFSLDGQYLISASEDGDLRLWRKFEKRSFLHINPLRNGIKTDDIHSSVEIEFASSPKLVPRAIKNMIYIRNVINRSEKKRQFKSNTRILPGYLSFKPKDRKII